MAQLIRQRIKVGESVNGTEHSVMVFRVQGEEPGPKVYIQANLHGAEVQGNAVIYHLLKYLQQARIRGEIVLVPQANPLGASQKSGEYTLGRFDPVTGANWNRQYFHNLDFIEPFVADNLNENDNVVRQRFKAALQNELSKAKRSPFGLKTGQHLCFTLQSMAYEADYVIDLHTGPKSSRHLYVPEYARASAGLFNISNVLLIPNEFDGALDEACFVPWWKLSEAFAAKGRHLPTMQEAFTVELGSEETIDLEGARFDADGIMSFLSHKEMLLDRQFEPAEIPRYGCYLEDYKVIHAPRGGLAEYIAPLGQILPAGEPLVNLLHIDRFGQEDEQTCIALTQDVMPILHGASANVMQGTEIFKVFYRFFPLD